MVERLQDNKHLCPKGSSQIGATSSGQLLGEFDWQYFQLVFLKAVGVLKTFVMGKTECAVR